MDIVIIVGAVIALTLFFDFTNGFHDASSVVATSIACGAMTPQRAIAVAGVFTVLGAVLGGSAVVYTIQELVHIDTGTTLALVLLAGMVGAIFWNLLTWRLGLPSSSTHALVGGLVGAALVAAGTGSIEWGFGVFIGPGHELKGVTKVLLALFISPPIGLGLAYLLQKAVVFSLRNSSRKVNRWLNGLQYGTAALLAYSHGANDTQKHMGIIMLALISGSMVSTTEVPIWVRVVVGVVMLLGTMGGGWTIMRTLGQKIYRLEPVHSMNSQVASATSVLAATVWGGPISTTHVVGSSVMGAGAGDEVRMVSWQVGRDMLLAWLITIPASALVSALIYLPLRLIGS